MKNFDRLTLFTKFYVYGIIPEPSRVDFPCILQSTTFICQLMVLMAHAIRRDYHKTLAGTDLQIYFGDFSS